MSDRVIELIDGDPSLVEILVRYDPENPPPAFVPDPAMLENLAPDFRASIEASAAHHAQLLQTATARLDSLGIGGDDVSRPVSIHKAWHGLHFLLAGPTYGQQEPPANSVLGGREVGADLGYGPARCFDATQTSAIAEALGRLDVATTSACFDPGGVAHAYCLGPGDDLCTLDPALCSPDACRTMPGICN